MHLVLLTFALVLFLVAAVIPPPYDGWRLRVVAFGLAAWVAAGYPF